jgi:hypothetical protein
MRLVIEQTFRCGPYKALARLPLGERCGERVPAQCRGVSCQAAPAAFDVSFLRIVTRATLARKASCELTGGTSG